MRNPSTVRLGIHSLRVGGRAIALDHAANHRLKISHYVSQCFRVAETLAVTPMSPETVSRSSSISTTLARRWLQSKRENCEPGKKDPDPDAQRIKLRHGRGRRVLTPMPPACCQSPQIPDGSPRHDRFHKTAFCRRRLWRLQRLDETPNRDNVRRSPIRFPMMLGSG